MAKTQPGLNPGVLNLTKGIGQMAIPLGLPEKPQELLTCALCGRMVRWAYTGLCLSCWLRRE